MALRNLDHITVHRNPEVHPVYVHITVDMSHYPGVTESDARWSLRSPDSTVRPNWMLPENIEFSTQVAYPQTLMFMSMGGRRATDEKIRTDVDHALRHAPMTTHAIYVELQEVTDQLEELVHRPSELPDNEELHVSLTMSTGARGQRALALEVIRRQFRTTDQPTP